MGFMVGSGVAVAQRDLCVNILYFECGTAPVSIPSFSLSQSDLGQSVQSFWDYDGVV